MSKIKSIKAREVLDSRGNPTIEVDLITSDSWGRAIVPSGASTGVHEALELRDNDKKRFLGLGVRKAIQNVNKLSKKLKGLELSSQQRILDLTLIDIDGTQNKSKLGANAILGVSLAAARASAMSNDCNLYENLAARLKTNPLLPVPFANVINGGAHAGNNLNLQEFMIAPIKAKSFFEAARIVSETYHLLKGIIIKKYGKGDANVGDEGGFAPNIYNAEEALDLIMNAIDKSGYSSKIKIAIDAAASGYYKEHRYTLGDKILDASKLSDYYQKLISDYPIISFEDGFAEDDFDAWTNFTKKTDIQVVGDDLTVTNIKRIEMAINQKMCNALLLKVNQIGTLTEAIDAAKLAQKNDWGVMVSHRSGESEDPFISDLTVALACGQIKLGAPCRSERTSKYNQLIRIEEELGNKARFAKLKLR